MKNDKIQSTANVIYCGYTHPPLQPSSIYRHHLPQEEAETTSREAEGLRLKFLVYLNEYFNESNIFRKKVTEYF